MKAAICRVESLFHVRAEELTRCRRANAEEAAGGGDARLMDRRPTKRQILLHGSTSTATRSSRAAEIGPKVNNVLVVLVVLLVVLLLVVLVVATMGLRLEVRPLCISVHGEPHGHGAVLGGLARDWAAATMHTYASGGGVASSACSASNPTDSGGGALCLGVGIRSRGPRVVRWLTRGRRGRPTRIAAATASASASGVSALLVSGAAAHCACGRARG